MVVAATIDGRLVPLAYAGATIVRAATGVRGAAGSPVGAAAPTRDPGAAPRRDVRLAVLVHATIDTLQDVGWGGGARIDVGLRRRLALTAQARFTSLELGATPRRPVTDSLAGRLFVSEVLAGVAARLWSGTPALEAHAAAGPALAIADARVGETAASGEAWRAVGVVAAGMRIPLGPLRLGIDGGVRVTVLSTPGTWDEPPISVFTEVSCGVTL